MSDRVTALGGAAFDGAVGLREMPLQGMISLRGDLASPVMQAAVKAAVGVSIPALRSINGGVAGGAAWMSPDELLLLCPYEDAEAVTAKLHAELANAHAMATNVSDARALFHVQGAALRDTLAKLAPVDMSPAAFGVGQIRRTRLAQVAAAFWLATEDEAYVICFRSVAEYVYGLLSVAGDPDAIVGFHHTSG